MTVGGTHFAHGGVMNGTVVNIGGHPQHAVVAPAQQPYATVMRTSSGVGVSNGGGGTVMAAQIQGQPQGQAQYMVVNGQLMLVQTQQSPTAAAQQQPGMTVQYQQVAQGGQGGQGATHQQNGTGQTATGQPLLSFQTVNGNIVVHPQGGSSVYTTSSTAPTAETQAGQVDLHQVYKTVWIGAYTALNSNVLVQRNIRFVCNTARELYENGGVYGVDWRTMDQTGITVKHTSWDDNAQEQIWPFSSTTLDALTFIENAVQKGQNILVNCLMGRSRSTSLVLAFMIYSEGFTLDKALETVLSKRSVVAPNSSFLMQLRQLENAMQTAPHRPIKPHSPTVPQSLNGSFALVPASPQGSFTRNMSGAGNMSGISSSDTWGMMTVQQSQINQQPQQQQVQQQQQQQIQQQIPQQQQQQLVQHQQAPQQVQAQPQAQHTHQGMTMQQQPVQGQVAQSNGSNTQPHPAPAQPAQAGMLVLYDEQQAQLAQQQHQQQYQQAQAQQQMHIQALQGGGYVMVPVQQYMQESARSHGGMDSSRYTPWAHPGGPQGNLQGAPGPRVGGGAGHPGHGQHAPPAVPVPLPNPGMQAAPAPPPPPGMTARRPRMDDMHNGHGPPIRMSDGPASARTPHVGTSLLGPSLPEYERGHHGPHHGGPGMHPHARYVPLNDGYGAGHAGATAERMGWGARGGNGGPGRAMPVPLVEPHYAPQGQPQGRGGYPVGAQGQGMPRGRMGSAGGLPRTTSAPDLPAMQSARIPADEPRMGGPRLVPIMGAGHDGRLYRSHTPGRKQIDPRLLDGWYN